MATSLVASIRRIGQAQLPAELSIGIAIGRSLVKFPVMQFVASLDHDEDGIWISEGPAVPGCVSQGSTRDAALAKIGETIAICLEMRAERGLPLTTETRQIEVTV
jgi:predicted RNase H-like HicB family nuclease